jgi:hypothetical protein
MAKAPLRCRNEASNHNNGDPGGIIQGPRYLAPGCLVMLRFPCHRIERPRKTKTIKQSETP